MTFEMPSVLRIEARPVLIPFRRSVQPASFVIPEVPLVLIDLHTDRAPKTTYNPSGFCDGPTRCSILLEWHVVGG